MKEAGNEDLSSSLGAVSSIILVHGVENVIAFRAYTMLATTKTVGKYGLSHNFNISNRAKKSDMFLNIMPCSPSKVNRRFEGKYRLHPQD
jgi:hypothetical protein